METLWRDLRVGLRGLRKQLLVTIVAVATLALGIGANTAIFSAVDAALLSELPYPEGERLAMLWLDNRRLGIETDITSYPNFRDTREQATVFEDLAVFVPTRSNLTGDGGDPVRLDAALLGANVLEILGVAPALGRGFEAAQDREGSDPAVLLSHALWQRRFAGDPGVLGRTLRINGEARTVVGVMPPGFAFPRSSELWLPLELGDDMREERGSFWLYQVGRLRPGVSRERAQTEMDAIAARLVEEHDFMAGYGLYLQPLREYLVGEAGPILWTLFGAVGFVLLIACANVAHLLLARAAAREREMSLRLALGAGRGQLLRQLLAEAALLGLVGGALGVAVALAGVRLLNVLGPEEWRRLGAIAVDGRVLAFTLGVSLLTGIAAGLVPALQSSRRDLAGALQEGARATASRRRRRLRGAMVVAEVALALVLLIGAGLLVRSLDRLLRVDPGMRSGGLLLVDLTLPRAAYSEDERVIDFYGRLLERLEALPGVERAAATSGVLLPQLARSGVVSIEGQPDRPSGERIEVTLDAVTPGVFQALGIPLLEGRDLGPRDVDGATLVAVVNRSMAERYWPGESALGRRFKFGSADDEDDYWLTVVGVVGDARRTGLEKAARPSAYLTHAQIPMRGMTLLVEGGPEPLSLVPAVREAVRAIDPEQPLGEITTLDRRFGERLVERRFQTALLTLFSALALVLALVGIYGVLAHAVSESRRDLGVRLALGASRGDVLRLVLGQGLALVAVGVVLGLLAAAGLTRTLAALLYDVRPLDPVTFAVLPLLLVAAALLATYLPARRATRVEPTEVLRYE